jgi:hypothetical protein
MQERDLNTSFNSQSSFTSQEKARFEKYIDSNLKRKSTTSIDHEKVFKKIKPGLDADPSSNVMIHISLDKLAIKSTSKDSMIKETVKEDVKQESAKEDVKQEPAKEEVKKETDKEEVKKETDKEEVKKEISEIMPKSRITSRSNSKDLEAISLKINWSENFIKEIKEQLTNLSVAMIYEQYKGRIPMRTLFHWKKNKDISIKTKNKGRKPMFGPIEELLFDWFLRRRGKMIAVSDADLFEKTRKIKKKITVLIVLIVIS